MQLNPLRNITVVSGLTVGDYWAWAHSDLLSNTERAVFAEFLVAAALNETRRTRQEWESYDVLYREKWKIEVKCSAYLQNWHQKSLSKIIFSVRPAREWKRETNEVGQDLKHNADCYVFCLYSETAKEKANVLDIGMWRFYVISTLEVERHFGEAKSVGLAKLERVCGSVGFEGLKKRVNMALYIDD
jgi:hypothetical protein